MLFATTTNAYAGIGAITSVVFSDVSPFIYLVGGIVLAFFIIEMLMGILSQEKENTRVNKFADRIEKEYHDLTGTRH